MANMSSSLISKTVTPFLREHIPHQYAPISKADNEESSKTKDPNSKFCYRHMPDSKCRRAADETKMVTIQRVCFLLLWRLDVDVWQFPPRLRLTLFCSTGTRPVTSCRPTSHHACVVPL